MSLFSTNQKILLFLGGVGLLAPLVRNQFLQFRFLGHDSQPELEARFESLATKKEQRIISALKAAQFTAWNIIVPFTFCASTAFHTVRILRHAERMPFKEMLIRGMVWSVVPTMVAFLLPFYAIVYPFIAPPSVARQVSNDYITFLLTSKDPHWREHVALMNNGDILPIQTVVEKNLESKVYQAGKIEVLQEPAVESVPAVSVAHNAVPSLIPISMPLHIVAHAQEPDQKLE